MLIIKHTKPIAGAFVKDCGMKMVEKRVCEGLPCSQRHGIENQRNILRHQEASECKGGSFWSFLFGLRWKHRSIRHYPAANFWHFTHHNHSCQTRPGMCTAIQISVSPISLVSMSCLSLSLFSNWLNFELIIPNCCYVPLKMWKKACCGIDSLLKICSSL